jgi:NADH:ubiquinone oxidoreductase subunit F (NADH-binding)/NADH:ubiquinone oxidoreductase subunit E
MIVQALHEIQRTHRYLPRSELKALARRLDVPLYRIQAVASFFPHFRLDDHPPPALEVRVCRDMACHLRGATGLLAALVDTCQQVAPGTSSASGVSCLGRCDRAPVVLINDKPYSRSAEALKRAIAASATGNQPPADLDLDQPLTGSQPWTIDVYANRPRYEATRQFLALPDPARIIEALKTAGLLGMGGAGVPAHQKWNDVRQAEGSEKYIICNADESEPGTFKDRELLLRTPHLIVEGVLLAGLVTGASRGYVFIRHEYPEEAHAVEKAIKEAESLGLCGSSTGSDARKFPIEVFISPGGYICGEQSALVEAMEDHRAEPRNRPPQLETNGLHDKPTLVSNVETFAWTPGIALHGGDWYASQGLHGYKGKRFFSIAGDVERPGVYEVPIGTRLGELIDHHAGGMRNGLTLKAFAPSGPSGGFLPARIPIDTLPRGFEGKLPESFKSDALAPGASHIDLRDLWLDLNFFRILGLMLGAGLVVYGEGVNMADQALNAMEFFRNESCGKCVPCRIGSQKLVEIGSNLTRSAYDQAALKSIEPLIRDLASTMTLTSICGLGAVAPNPLVSVLQYFRDDVAHYLARS